MRHAALILLAVAAAACGGSTTAPSTVASNATITNDVFNGVVQVGGLNVHNFTVTTPGTVTVTMTSAGPPSTITMGLGIGNPNAAGGCTFITTTQGAASTTTPLLSGTLTASGAYCIAIGDVGNAAGPISYSITVSHT